MFDPHRQVPAFNIPVERPPATEFTVRLELHQAAVLQMIADRGGVTPQELMQGLATGNPFRATVSICGPHWITTCPDTGKDIPADMTDTRNDWFDGVLYHANLLKGDALQRYLLGGRVSDGSPEGVEEISSQT